MKQILVFSYLFFLLSGCGASQDILTGTWNLQSYTCRGTDYKLPSGVAFAITYTAPNLYAGTFTNTATACKVILSGQFERKGLSVHETVTQMDCGSGCTIPPISPSQLAYSCTGVNSVSTNHDSRITVPTLDTLEQSQHAPFQLCDNGGRVNETNKFLRVTN